MLLLYLGIFFYGVVFLVMLGMSAYMSHRSNNPRYIAAWWLGILLHILFPLAFMHKTEDGYEINIFIENLHSESKMFIFVGEFIVGLVSMWILEKITYVPEKIVAIIYSILSYSSIYSLLMIALLSSGNLPLFWINGFVLSILFYISFISSKPLGFMLVERITRKAN